MKIILAGHFESAFVRLHDQQASPGRNTTGHEYYMDLNRNTDRLYRDGAGTFIALAETVTVPWELDWGGPGLTQKYGVEKTACNKEDLTWQHQYDIIEKFIDDVLRKNVLSAKSIAHITGLDLAGYDEEIALKFIASKPSKRLYLVSSYLRRLLHQIYATQGQAVYLLVAEPEVQILSDLGEFLASGHFPYQMPFPD